MYEALFDRDCESESARREVVEMRRRGVVGRPLAERERDDARERECEGPAGCTDMVARVPGCIGGC